MREAIISFAVVFVPPLLWWVWPRLRDRFAPAPVPVGWTEESFAEIRPSWDEPVTGEILIIDPHLGPLPVIEPVPAWLFEATREVHSVDWEWEPAWLSMVRS